MYFRDRRMKEEIDRTLYFDSNKKVFFVVESTEYESGPAITINHSIHELDTTQLQSLLEKHPELLEKADELKAQ